ncbi:calcium-binding protein [Streptomyces odontomachi]|uniref:calcium-binding protein n=1 Tax=Streptomyces odontomachi TaxID=2944940 RepID=UPI00210D2619|nr:calcium-binding protein [Streptomyces sp. ODS25]
MRTLRTLAATATATASLALAMGGAVLAAPVARADTPTTATLVHADGELWYKAGADQANDLTVTAQVVDTDPTQYGEDYLLTFSDTVDITLSTDECTYPSQTDHTLARCTVPIPLGSDDSDDYDVDLGDGADTVTIPADSSAYASIHGGPGDDVLNGNDAVVLYGDDGNDRIDGGGGVWSVGAYGGTGDDTLTGCDAECHGGDGDDDITGTATDQEFGLYGDDGDDVIHGGAGADMIYGGKGDDTLYGDAGDDTIYGNSGNDVLHGGTGTDTLSGGPGTNEVHQD